MTINAPTESNWLPLRMIEAPKRPYLVIVRTGDKSIHTQWARNPGDMDRKWDLLLSHYGDAEPTCVDAEMIVRQGSFKYPACHRLFEDIGWLQQYRAVWLCDDDIMTSWGDINRLFELFDRYELMLAQPALEPGSYFSHDICIQDRACLMRFTNFVEIMAPVFSAQALQICLPIFKDAVTGWGMDWVWPHLLGDPRTKIAVIDDVAVRHTRPVGRGTIYQDAGHKGMNPFAEHHMNVEKYGVVATPLIYGAVTAQPQPFGVTPVRTLSAEAIVEMDGVTALLNRRAPTLREKYQWSSTDMKAAQMHESAPLGAGDLVMSFGGAFALQPLSGDAIEILQIGGDRNQCRVLVTAHQAGEGQFELVMRLYDRDNLAMSLRLPSLAVDVRHKMAVQLVPCTGYVTIIFDGSVVLQGLVPQWRWHAVDRLWLGSKRLKAVLQDVWVSPLALDKTGAAKESS